MATSKIKVKKVCEWCGQEFHAQKVTTRFCSKRCAEHAYKDRLRNSQVQAAEQKVKEKTVLQPLQELQSKAYLSISETATILGLTRMSIYNLIYSGKLRASKLSGRLTLIRKEDIETMLSWHIYAKNPKPASESVSEFYTTKEVKEKFGVSESWLFKVGKEKNIPKIFRMGKTYWSKKHIDKHLSKPQTDTSITQWYSVDDIKEKFGMTTSAVYCFVSEHAIPKKKEKQAVFYSKTHVDIAKGVASQEPEQQPEYYTMKEAMEKFKMTRDQLYHYVKKFNIPKVMEGKYVKLSKNELDAALASLMAL